MDKPKLVPMDRLGPDCRVINRVPYTNQLKDLPLGHTELNIVLGSEPPEFWAAIVDLETTGLSATEDDVIQLGILTVGLDEKGNIVTINSAYKALNEPSEPLSSFIIKHTGLTDQILDGHTFDVKEVMNKELKNVDFVIAHNASFDRPFMDATFGNVWLPWFCSCRGDADWKSLGYPSSALKNILSDQGFFFDGHDAIVDCMAVAWSLITEPKVIRKMLAQYKNPPIRVEATGAPFDKKDDLKKAGFRWDPAVKVWFIESTNNRQLSYVLNLLDDLYKGGSTAFIQEVNLTQKYKAK